MRWPFFSHSYLRKIRSLVLLFDNLFEIIKIIINIISIITNSYLIERFVVSTNSQIRRLGHLWYDQGGFWERAHSHETLQLLMANMKGHWYHNSFISLRMHEWVKSLKKFFMEFKSSNLCAGTVLVQQDF